MATREEAKERVKRDIPCTQYLEKSKDKDKYCCPFCDSGHKEHGDGAMHYYRATNTAHCFSCRKECDVIDLRMKATGENFSEALEALSKDLGITITPYSLHRPMRHTKSEEALAEKAQGEEQPAHEEPEPDYMLYYATCLRNIQTPEALEYLKLRGISLKTAYYYGLGFDPAADPAHAPGAVGDEFKSKPTPRIIIPVTSATYIGRATVTIDKKWKALYPKGAKSAIWNVQALENAQDVFVVEGVFDALSVIESGETAIALCSTNNVNLLLKYIGEHGTEAHLILCGDKDDAGQRAVKDMKTGLLELGVSFSEADISGQYKDANECFCADRDAFTRMVASAKRAAHPDEVSLFFDKIQTDAYRPYKTELPFFDNLLGGGILQQSLLLLMAAPGTGKTTLAQRIAEAMADHQKPVIYLNLEMSREQMLAKAISSRMTMNGAPMTAEKVLQGYNWDTAEKYLITETVEDYRHNTAPFIKYNPDGIGSDLDEILSYLKGIGEKAKAEKKQAPAVVVDYLHLISSRSGLDATELVKAAVTGLKDYAKNYDTFVIAIVATNRTSNSSGRLTMESGRDSSALEYTGDYQLSLNYADIDSGEVSPNDVEKVAELQQEEYRRMIIRVLKCRLNSPGRSANCYFDAAHNMFYGEQEWTLSGDKKPFPHSWTKATKRI